MPPLEDDVDTEVDALPPRNVWKCGETNIDSKLLKFCSVLGITVGSMSFCIAMIVTSECGDEQIYLTVLTGLISYWMPSPEL